MIVGQKLFNELDAGRLACILGELSGGKTRLAFDIASHYWHDGYRVVSNVPHNFKYDAGEVTPQFGHEHINDLFRTFVILDEGGEYVRSQDLASSITRAAGKANYYFVFAGKRLPHKSMTELIIRPLFNFYTWFGIPAILWRGQVNATDKYKFKFWQTWPDGVHGTYSTLSSSAGIERVIALAKNTVSILAQHEGHEAGLSTSSGIEGLADDIASTITE